MEVYERIKERRKEIGLSSDDVASALNVSRATVYRYESAEIEKLPTNIIIPLSRVLRCDPAWLMGWSDNAPVDELELSDLERRLIVCFRELSDDEKKIVLRSVGINQ